MSPRLPPDRPPLLADAPFLKDPLVARVLALLSCEGAQARVVGGAVRDHLLGLPETGDVDIATTLTPEAIIARVNREGLQHAPTGIGHGTVTVIGLNRIVEVTTLREDVETDGRHAVVRFGTDWALDARRRDFTVNALSLDPSGRLHDYVGGYDDLRARHIRFIGDPDRRIAEDRLRVLRFFRFHALYGAGPLDEAGLAAAIRARHALRDLSAERVGQEMRRIVRAPGAGPAIRTLQESGLLPLIVGGVGRLCVFERLLADAAAPDDAAFRFAALFGFVQEDIARITQRFRLSNRERDRMTAVLAAKAVLADGHLVSDRAAIYARGADSVAGGLALLAAQAWRGADDIMARREAAAHFAAPVFPLTGRDVVESGIARGPAVGLMLRRLEDWWLQEDFQPDQAALRRRLQAMIAAQ